VPHLSPASPDVAATHLDTTRLLQTLRAAQR